MPLSEANAALAQARIRPVTNTEGARPITTIAGFSPLRLGLCVANLGAMMVGLYAAFWLQLESASSAAVTVGILALQTRGQVYQKAVYRILATIIGIVASFVIVGLFPQTRDLFLLGFAGWLGLCVYVGGFLDGNRAYGAVLRATRLLRSLSLRSTRPRTFSVLASTAARRSSSELPRLASSATYSPPGTYIRAWSANSRPPIGGCGPSRSPSSAARARTRSTRQICCVRSQLFTQI